MNEERFDEAILYMLDSLDEVQRIELEQAMRSDVLLAAETHSLNDAIDAMSRAVPQVSPPVELRGRILAEIGSLPQENTGDPKITAFPKPKRDPALWLAAAAVLMLGGLLIWNQLREPGLIPDVPPVVEVVPMPPHMSVPMEGQSEAYLEANARVTWNPQRRDGRIEAESLPALPEGRTYQIWILDTAHEAPLPAGIFDHEQDGPAIADFQTDVVTSRTVQVAVSIEPVGGSLQPTGPVVLVSAETGG